MSSILKQSFSYTWRAGLLISFAALLSTRAAAQSSEVCFDVQLRGGSTEICADVHDNPRAPLGTTVLAVHGFTGTAATWQPLVNAMFNDSILRRSVGRVIAIDLPGHGDSSLPFGLPGGLFGDLLIQDYVGVLLQAIDILRAQGLGARTVLGHSMGGLIIQSAQETLLAQQSSLAAHGVLGAILLAPVPVANVPWAPASSSNLSPFVVFTPELGAYLDIPPALLAQSAGFRTFAGTLVPGVPDATTMEAYVGLEPLNVGLQLGGQIPRPSAREGAFATVRGTVLSVISLSQDLLVPATFLGALYVHLLGRQGLLYRPVVSPLAAHNMHITDPMGLLTELRSLPYMF